MERGPVESVSHMGSGELTERWKRVQRGRLGALRSSPSPRSFIRTCLEDNVEVREQKLPWEVDTWWVLPAVQKTPVMGVGWGPGTTLVIQEP